MSLQGQWSNNGENQGPFPRSEKNSKRTKTTEITEEEDFSGNPQVRSKESDPTVLADKLASEEATDRRDINEL